MTLPNPTRRATGDGRPTRQGLAAVLLVLALALLAGLAALTIDLSMVFYSHEQLRAGCEAAALAGAPRLMNRNVLYPSRGPQPFLVDEDDGTGDAQFDHDRARNDSDPGSAMDDGVADDGVADDGVADDGEEQAGLHAIRCAVGIREYEQQVLAARRAAVDLASRNRAAGQAIRLDENLQNLPEGDVVVGWVAHPERIGCPLELPECGPLNTVLARGRREESRGNPLTMWMGQLLGMPTCDVQALARATLDQRVYGFRATELASAPVMPIAAPLGGRRHGWLNQALCAALPSDNDCFSVDPETGCVTRGGDGIPEIRLRLSFPSGGDQGRHGDDADHHDGNRGHRRHADDPNEHDDHDWGPEGTGAVALAIGEGEAAQTACWRRLLRQLESGVSAADLTDVDGILQLGDRYPACRCRNRHETLALRQACLDLRGQLRAWPLCVPACEGGRRGEWEIVGFAAARIVAAEVDDDRGRACTIVVQADVMISSQALTGPCTRRNPWIAKVELTQ